MKYERLTQWTENGASLILDNPQNENEAREQLMQKFKLACNKLAELEDKIEQGLMIKLPVKLTEKCYVIFGRNEKYIKEVCVIMYEIGTVDQWARVIWYEGDRKLWEDFHTKELYPTREEAEKRLKELQNG